MTVVRTVHPVSEPGAVEEFVIRDDAGNVCIRISVYPAATALGIDLSSILGPDRPRLRLVRD